MLKIVNKKLDSHFTEHKINPDDFFDFPNPEANESDDEDEDAYDAAQAEAFREASPETKIAPASPPPAMTASKPPIASLNLANKKDVLDYLAKYDPVKLVLPHYIRR